MKRLAAAVLAGALLLAAAPAAFAQALKERSLSDPPPKTQTAPPPPAQQAAPAGQTPPAPTSVGVQPAGQQPSAPQYQPQAAQPAPGQQGAPQYAPQQPYQPAPTGQPYQAPQPAPTAAPGYQGAPQGQHTPPPSAQPSPYSDPAGGTMVNGQPIGTVAPPPPPAPDKPGPYNRDEVNREVMGFFEGGSRGLAELVARAFKDLGQPVGFIKGNEGGGALVVGFRYGIGTLYLKGQPPVPIYWQSPSLGFDLGVNAGKVFTLVYGMTRTDQIFQRFPGVDGSAYVLGGFGMNYQRSGDITLAPIRVGVGLRLGASVGYQSYTREQTINPF
ncbi:MAG: hypothetical protein B193_1963 [Solidesulfovibrio magneticus str. Maddingley MBC34]|uniref:DUF1134 domain-containing protein n=1 Tax=Solidesulfovibrio magneticus str. Maddingley MBC34 TaxID=1206767 RepID=K6GQV3_9BACT|nr:MAG: hypothetical protein B193_1963 [Solidesulfovibrio magneticus str. Maddingley MBC34]